MANYELFMENLSTMPDMEFLNFVKDNYSIHSYIPIGVKYSTISLIKLKFDVDSYTDFLEDTIDVVYAFERYEIIKTIILLGMYLDVEFKTKDATAEVYDKLVGSGVLQYVRIRSDYEDFSRKCDDVIGIHNVSVINNLNELFDKSANIANFNNILQELQTVMQNPDVRDTVGKLLDFEKFNNPMLASVIESAKTKAQSEARQNG